MNENLYRWVFLVQMVAVMTMLAIVLGISYQINQNLSTRAEERAAQSNYFRCIVVIPIDERTPERIAPCLAILEDAGLGSG